MQQQQHYNQPQQQGPSFERPPGPVLNGGLYTGAPFAPGAAWANVPVTPDAGFYNFANLATLPSALPLAQAHVPGGGLRPGNNTPLLPPDIAAARVGPLNSICIPDARLELRAGDPQLAPDPDAARGYAGGFAYL